MSYISSAGFTPKLTIVKVHIRHTNLVPEIEAKVDGTSILKGSSRVYLAML